MYEVSVSMALTDFIPVILFGIAAVGLPFVIKARPMKKLIGDREPWIILAGIDLALFMTMMSMISSHGRLTLGTFLFTIGVFAGIGLIVSEILKRRRAKK